MEEDSFIPIARPSLDETELANVVDSIESGWISSKGPNIPLFEERFAKYCNRRYGVAVSNGTAALHLALLTAGIGKEAQVAVPSLTFIATVNSVSYVGGRPIFIDANSETWCMDTKHLRRFKNLKAVIPVHLYGHPVDMDALESSIDDDCIIIEDAAEAHGALYKGRPVGSFGLTSCFSFYGNKIVTTGEGGMCLTDDADLANRLRMFRDHGMDPSRQYVHPVIGYNYRMTNLQAAVGVAQLSKIDKLIAKKRWIAKKYMDIIDSDVFVFPAELSWAKNVYWMFSVLVKGASRGKRDRIINAMRNREVETRPFFFPNNLQPPYRGLKQRCPNSESISSMGINLPSFPGITEEEIQRVSNSLSQAYKEADGK